MEEIIDVQEYMRRLVTDRVTPEDLVSCTIRNLYSLERSSIAEHKIALINNIRACIAYVKLLYDYGQNMDLARTYLLHKIKFSEVRENDLNMEISILRGLTPPVEDVTPSNSDAHIQLGNQNCTDEQDVESDPELEIILDTRMIREIDHSKEVLHSIINRIEGKKNALEEIEQQIEDTSMMLLSSVEYSKSSFEREHTESDNSLRVERTQVLETTNSSRVSGARISPQKITQMEMSQDNEKGLLSQGALGYPRDRQGGEPDAAGSTVDGRKSSEGTAGVVSVSAPAAQTATAEQDKDPNKGESHVMEAHSLEVSIRTASEKRKASESPDSDIEGEGNTGDRRVSKARTMELRMDGGDEETITIINERSERSVHSVWQRENQALKKEIVDLKQDNCRQREEINQLKRMISELTREVRSLRESMGSTSTVVEKSACSQSAEKRSGDPRNLRKGKLEDGRRKEMYKRENTYLETDVEL